ncbi:MAG: glycosyltransferase family 4 protein, partial [Alphaproteobacteria bacterium]
SVHGIRSLPLERLIAELADPSYTAVIFCGRWLSPMVQIVRKATKAPLIAWMHESTFNPKLVPIVGDFNAIAFVSEWQQRINQKHIPKYWTQAVIRNAMNPAAENMFGSNAVLAQKKEPPLLLYAGSAARGAFHLPAILDHLREMTVDFSMEIYCNTNPSGDPAQDEQYIGWLRSLPNITHVGMVGQNRLISRMKEASVFVAPNPWPETSCIAMIEAMAAGLKVVTTNRAALPETASGFAKHIVIDDPDSPTRFDALIDASLFAKAVREAMQDKNEAKQREQVDYFNTHYRWQKRVEEWVSFLNSL